jgi:hypothetical protein
MASPGGPSLKGGAVAKLRLASRRARATDGLRGACGMAWE